LLAFLCFTLGETIAAVAGARLASGWSWVHGVCLVLAACTMLAALARWLPVQNVVACGLVLSLTSAMALAFSVKQGFPFGRFEFSDALGPRLLEAVAWPVPFLWVAVLLASRQTAKVILQPWRRSKPYGWWLLGTATTLTAVQALALDPFGHRVMEWWTWPKTDTAVTWYGAPLLMVVGALLLAVALLVLAGPWLVSKRPTGRLPDFEPVWVWLGLMVWWTAGNLRAGLWLAAAVALLAGGAVFWLAWRGAGATVGPPARRAVAVSA
jgi:uncharacterized membrane protein